MSDIDYVLSYLMKEQGYNDTKLPNDNEIKKRYIRTLMNIRKPLPIDDKFLEVQDRFLQNEIKNKGIIEINDNNLITLYKGDITLLKVDAIVNAANEYVLGCFIPGHNCIDNAIHTFSGIELRLKCNEIMNGKTLNTSDVIITPAYNLPSKYIIHTVGPIVPSTLTNEHKELLKKCYINSLNIAAYNNIKTIAFPCISTGVFNFPKEDASLIAINTVRKYLEDNPNTFDKVVFNVFGEEDYQIYKKNLYE